MLKPLEIPSLTVEELEALEKLYRTTKEVRLRTRAQIVLLAGEQRMTAPTIACDRARRRSNGPQLAETLDGGGDQRTQRSAHARAAAETHGRVEGAITGVSPASASQPGTTLFDVDVAALVGLHGGANQPPGLL